MLPRDRMVVFRRMMDGLQPISRLDIPTADETSNIAGGLDSFIGNMTAVASYSWADVPSPTIVIPGSPPVLTLNGVSFPLTVPEDTAADHTKHWHTHELPFNLEPLLSSVLHLQPDFPFQSIHLVTERAFLLKLLGWIRRSADLDFCFDIQLAGSTMLCTHCAIQPKGVSRGGYGRNFEHAVTAPAPVVVGVGTSESDGPKTAEQMGHYRIVRYNFCGLELLVRYEVDACLPPESPSSEPQADSPSSAPYLGLSSQRLATPSGIKVIHAGTLIEQPSIVELKSLRRATQTNKFWKKTFPQLFFSQMEHLLVGLHERGEFTDIEPHTLESVQNYCACDEEDFRKLAAVLHRIYALVVAEGDGTTLSLACIGRELKLYRRRDGRQVLPTTMISLFKCK